MHPLAKMLIIVGGIIVLIGVILLFANNIPYIGRLPGDIIIKRKNFTFYFPLTTLIILNLVIYLIVYLLRK
ncbi:MAG: DUF2905 domain-containing protein [Calditrichia bacterium]